MSKKNRQGGRELSGDRLSRITDIYVLAMLVVFPLLIGPELYHKFNVFKFGSCLVLFALYLAALAAAALPRIGGRAKGRSLGVSAFESIKRLSVPRIMMILYMLWGLISALASSYGKDCLIGQSRYEGLLSMLVYGGIFLSVSFFGSFKPKFVRGVAVSSLLMTAVALFQALGSGFLYPSGGTYADYIFLSTIGHIDCYAGVVSIFFPFLFCGYVLIDEKSLGFRAAELISIFLLLYTLLFSDVDSAKIAIPAAFVIAFVFLIDTAEHLAKTLQAGAVSLCAFALHWGMNIDVGGGFARSFAGGRRFFAALLAAALFAAAGVFLEKKKPRFRAGAALIRRIAAVVIVVLLIAALIYLFNYSGSKMLLREASELLHGRLSDEAGNFRGYIWKASWELIKAHPVLGSGPGTFFEEFTPYNEGYQVYFPNTIVDFAHNDFLQIGVCVGMVGLLIYIVFVVSLILRGLLGRSPFVYKFKASENAEGEAVKAPSEEAGCEYRLAVRIILLSAAAGYLAHSFFSFSIAIVTPLFWVLAGLLAAETNRRH